MANIINGTDTGSGGLITTGDSSDELQLQTAETARVTLTNTAVVVNEDGNDVDFRVESDTNANAFFVEGSSGNVGIGTASGAFSSGKGVVIADSTAARLKLADTDGGVGASDGFELIMSADNAYVWNYENASLLFGTNGTEHMRLDSAGNLGLGVTPSAWGSGQKAVQIGASGVLNGSTNTSLFSVGANTFYNGTANTYINTAAASLYLQSSGAHQWYTAASGTAGNTITFSQPMTLDASGNLILTGNLTAPLRRRGFIYAAGVSAGTTGTYNIDATGFPGEGSGASVDTSRAYFYIVHSNAGSHFITGVGLYSNNYNGDALLLATVGSAVVAGGTITFGGNGAKPRATITNSSGNTPVYYAEIVCLN